MLDSLSKRPMRTFLKDESLSIIGIPKEFRDKTIDDFEVQGDDLPLREVREYVREYIENIPLRAKENISLFFYGSNGTGKTMLSSIIIKEAYRRRYSVKRCTFSQFIEAYTNTWNNPDYRSSFAEDYYDVDFLALDEVGKELDTKIAIPTLESFLRHREEQGLPVIMCSNLNTKIFAERYGASIMSLIKGNFVPIQLDCADHRQEVFKERLKNSEK